MAQTIVRQAQEFDCRTFGTKTTKKASTSGREPSWPKVRMLPGLLVLVVLIVPGGISCIQAKQLQEQQQTAAQTQSSERNPGGQSSYYGDYALVSDNMVNLGQPYYNDKRARKFSAFMPMRGRKDGRDERPNQGGEQALLDGPASQDGELSAGLPFREIDGGEASILRLVRASLAANGPEQATGSLQWTGTPAPRQFANQLAARHMLISGAQPMMRQFSAATSPLEVADGYLYGSGEPTGLMQAKPRRAFHPMRGKKSELMFASPELDLADNELQA